MDLLTLSLIKDFPNLTQNNYTPTSPLTPSYNCIAWAAGDDTRWWQPDDLYMYYWPDGVTREYTLEAYVAAYAAIGYEICRSGRLEKKYEKIAIYLEPNTGIPKHAARQLRDGSWTSKLGQNIDISHDDPETLADGSYGVVVQYMRRKLVS